MDLLNGESLENYIMKQPKLSDLKKSTKETKAVRSKMANAKAVKITINIDSDSLARVKELSSETGVPYQRLLNRLLRESLDKKTSLESRMNRVEKEIQKLKKFIAA